MYKKVCVFVFLFYLYMFRVKYKQWDQAEMYYLEPSLWQEEIQMMMYYFPVLCSNSKCWVIQVILQMPNWALQHQWDPAHISNWVLYSSLLCLCRNNTDTQDRLLASHSWSSLSWTLLWHLETLLHEEILKQHKTDHYISLTMLRSTIIFHSHILGSKNVNKTAANKQYNNTGTFYSTKHM